MLEIISGQWQGHRENSACCLSHTDSYTQKLIGSYVTNLQQRLARTPRKLNTLLCMTLPCLSSSLGAQLVNSVNSSQIVLVLGKGGHEWDGWNEDWAMRRMVGPI